MRGTIESVNVNDTSGVRTPVLTHPKLRSITRCPDPLVRHPHRWKKQRLPWVIITARLQWTNTLPYVDFTTYGPNTHTTPTYALFPS